MKPPIHSARKSTLAIFFINGFVLSSWVTHIPLIKDRMNLGEGLLGIALLAVAAGAVTFMPLSGRWSSRFGSARITMLSALLFCMALPLPIFAPNFIFILPALFLFGASNGTMDVAMNAQAVAVEKEHGKPIMSSFHGFFSLGGLSGAGLGGWSLSQGLNPIVHVLSVSILMFAATLVAIRFLLPKGETSTLKSSKFVLPAGPLRALAALAFLVLLAEGAVMDWSSVYIKTTLQTGVGLAAAGYAAFSLMMAVGRLSGDRLVSKLGAVAITRVTALIAATGLAFALLIPHPLFAVIGFGLVGLGLSNLIPVLFSAAGKTPGVAPGIGISAVATAGYFGFLAGPPVIGFIAELVSLPVALGFVAAAILLVSFFSRLTDPAETDELIAKEACNEFA